MEMKSLSHSQEIFHIHLINSNLNMNKQISLEVNIPQNVFHIKLPDFVFTKDNFKRSVKNKFNLVYISKSDFQSNIPLIKNLENVPVPNPYFEHAKNFIDSDLNKNIPWQKMNLPDDDFLDLEIVKSEEENYELNCDIEGINNCQMLCESHRGILILDDHKYTCVKFYVILIRLLM